MKINEKKVKFYGLLLTFYLINVIIHCGIDIEKPWKDVSYD